MRLNQKITVALLATFLISGLTGCGSQPSEAPSSNQSNQAPETKPEADTETNPEVKPAESPEPA